MSREDIVRQALRAGRNAEHNLQVIAHNPEKMVSQKKFADGVAYLNTMIRFAEEEQQVKNARRAGRTLGLRTRLKSLLLSILADEREKSKGEVI